MRHPLRAARAPTGLICGLRRQHIDLVPDLDEILFLALTLDTQALEDRLDVGALGLGFRMADVAHMQDEVGANDLLERRAERGHKGCR